MAEAKQEENWIQTKRTIDNTSIFGKHFQKIISKQEIRYIMKAFQPRISARVVVSIHCNLPIKDHSLSLSLLSLFMIEMMSKKSKKTATKQKGSNDVCG